MSSIITPRETGVLLHPTSLPGRYPQGQLSSDAFQFVDFLTQCGFTAWQMLPLEPTNDDLSPYQSTSAFAGNTRLISPEQLADKGLIHELPEALDTVTEREQVIHEVWLNLQQQAHTEDREAFERFKQTQDWLHDYVLFSVIKEHCHNRAWNHWPEDLKTRVPEALTQIEKTLAQSITLKELEQFLFFQQWQALKDYSNERHIKLIGDLSIFVSHDSADVWANQSLFNLDDQGDPLTVSGVPPDYFSATGQRWGNPHYRWDVMQENKFKWWNQRVSHLLQSFDLIRIDHFRGFESYWKIDAKEDTAINGCWAKAPGAALFSSLQENHPDLPFIAEDLGVITDEVIKLRMQFQLPGMKILQFAFNDGGNNPYLPHNHAHNSVVYTGTHDNNTTLGWYNELDEHLRSKVHEYLGYPSEPMPWPLVRAALASVSSLSIIPMQDLLALDEQHRFNTPGTTEDNWRWRFQWGWVPESLTRQIKQMLLCYGRVPH